MAFYTVVDDVGRKTFHPTHELKALLQQDRVSEADLRVFRSSNKVEYLLTEVMKKRGFEHRYSHRDWVRVAPDAAKPKKSLISHFNDTLGMVKAALQAKKVAQGCQIHVVSGQNAGKTQAAIEAAFHAGAHAAVEKSFYNPQTDKQVTTMTLPVAGTAEMKAGMEVVLPVQGAPDRLGTVKEVITDNNGEVSAIIEFDHDPFPNKGLADETGLPLWQAPKQRKPKAKAVPKPVKRIIPPSQMKRKLAL